MSRASVHHLLATCLLASAGAGCGDATAPLPTDGVPDAFRVRFSGYGYGAHEVTLRGDTLRVVRRQFFDPRVGEESTTVVRGAEAWRAFWTAAREAGVDRWPRRCENARVADGGGFDLRIVAGGRTWEAEGTNSYPRANGRCTDSPSPSPEYERLTRAVTALIGRPFP